MTGLGLEPWFLRHNNTLPTRLRRLHTVDKYHHHVFMMFVRNRSISEVSTLQPTGFFDFYIFRLIWFVLISNCIEVAAV